MSLIVQVQKQKTADEIFPKWAKMLDFITSLPKDSILSYYETGAVIKERMLDEKLSISQNNKCIVGESHGFDDNYVMTGKRTCESCAKFSSGGFGNTIPSFVMLENNIRSGYIGKNWRNHITVTSFVEHWNKEH